jgi:hypothetical protein
MDTSTTASFSRAIANPPLTKTTSRTPWVRCGRTDPDAIGDFWNTVPIDEDIATRDMEVDRASSVGYDMGSGGC